MLYNIIKATCNNKTYPVQRKCILVQGRWPGSVWLGCASLGIREKLPREICIMLISSTGGAVSDSYVIPGCAQLCYSSNSDFIHEKEKSVLHTDFQINEMKQNWPASRDNGLGLNDIAMIKQNLKTVAKQAKLYTETIIKIIQGAQK